MTENPYRRPGADGRRGRGRDPVKGLRPGWDSPGEFLVLLLLVVATWATGWLLVASLAGSTHRFVDGVNAGFHDAQVEQARRACTGP